MFKRILLSLFFLLVSVSVRAQDFDSESRSGVISNVLDRIELAIEYQFLEGEQSFDVVDGDENLISKLVFPFSGNAVAVTAEVEITDRIRVGAKYGNSDLDKEVCSDEDWNFVDLHNGSLENIDYQRTEQDSNTDINFWDANLYYRVLDEKQAGERASHFWQMDTYSLDVLAGYQHYEANHTMQDPMISSIRYVNGSWWQHSGLPANIGLNSTYDIEYQGPRLGFRLIGLKGTKYESEINAVCSLLETKAHGYWNLRDYHFWQTGKNGVGINLDFKMRYNINDNWSIQVGYLYSSYKQKKMKESGTQPGLSYYDEDIIREVNTSFHGPLFSIVFRW